MALLVLGLILTFTTHHLFLTSDNLLKVARQASPYGIMAVGMVFVLVLGEVDLSVGSIYVLANIVTALALHANVPVAVAVIAGLGVGTACGAVNGVLSVVLGIPTIIVTIGTMSVFRGLALVACGAAPVSEFSKDNVFFTVAGGEPFGVPAGVIVMVAVAAIGWIWLHRTVAGRRVQAIGGNPTAGRLSGLSVNRYRVGVMALNGLIASLSGLMALAFLQAADPSDGQGFELWVIASAIIGGTALRGGSGSVTGAVLGALIIAVIQNGLLLLGAPANANIAVTGAVIILAVALDALVKRRSARG
ncbi:MAG TPA: ABC transporter permease [Chthonomonadaceae bacterium]|nr:ABC transporter permease [Chthonomonadaceae bacterium]